MEPWREMCGNVEEMSENDETRHTTMVSLEYDSSMGVI